MPRTACARCPRTSTTTPASSRSTGGCRAPSAASTRPPSGRRCGPWCRRSVDARCWTSAAATGGSAAGRGRRARRGWWASTSPSGCWSARGPRPRMRGSRTCARTSRISRRHPAPSISSTARSPSTTSSRSRGSWGGSATRWARAGRWSSPWSIRSTPRRAEPSGRSTRRDARPTYVNALVAAGFALTHLDEWGPSAEQVAAHPEWANERQRPPFLLVAARRA